MLAGAPGNLTGSSTSRALQASESPRPVAEYPAMARETRQWNDGSQRGASAGQTPLLWPHRTGSDPHVSGRHWAHWPDADEGYWVGSAPTSLDPRTRQNPPQRERRHVSFTVLAPTAFPSAQHRSHTATPNPGTDRWATPVLMGTLSGPSSSCNLARLFDSPHCRRQRPIAPY